MQFFGLTFKCKKITDKIDAHGFILKNVSHFLSQTNLIVIVFFFNLLKKKYIFFKKC